MNKRMWLGITSVAVVAGSVLGATPAYAVNTSTGVRCTIVGTAGNDTLNGTSGNDVICGLGGNDTINGQNGNDIIDAGDGNDTLAGSAGNDTLMGGNGTDTLRGGAGNDVINGGSGIDTASYTDATASVTANLSLTSAQNTGTSTGSDTLSANENLTGGASNDTLTGNGSVNVIDGGTGNDAINAGGGNDTVTAGAGNDVVNAGTGNDSVNGGDGSDTIIAGAGDDTVDAGSANDSVNGESGNDSLTGGTGSDTIDGGLGVDSCGITVDEVRLPSCDLLPLLSAYFVRVSGQFSNWNPNVTGCSLVYADYFYGGTVRALIPIQADGSYQYDAPPVSNVWSRITSAAAANSGGYFAADQSCPYDVFPLRVTGNGNQPYTGAVITRGGSNTIQARVPDLVQISATAKLPDGTPLPSAAVWCDTYDVSTPVVYSPSGFGWGDWVGAVTTSCGSSIVKSSANASGTYTFWAVRGQEMNLHMRVTVVGMSIDSTVRIVADQTKSVDVTLLG